ncbi:hypothetical protein ACGFMK_30840 [Amycolatopsis sp. NPDC049252]|uniref:hypothetical protein n=1 Tax=Amycolatopsis sp. NPDC049252 TaxID=3363933 RepID=UPI00371DD50E
MMTNSAKHLTDASLTNVQAMLDFAKTKQDPQRRAGIIADAQHLLGWAMRSAIAECESSGKPWRAVAATPQTRNYRLQVSGSSSSTEPATPQNSKTWVPAGSIPSGMELGRRPIHLAEPVFALLFGPADVSGQARIAWLEERARLIRLRRDNTMKA